MATLTARQLSELVPCAADDVERLQQLGLVTPDEEGLFPSSDVHVVRLMGAFETAGISLEAVAKGVAGGEFSFPMGLFLPEPAPRLETYEELGTRLDRAPELLRRLSRELGLPPAADDRVRVEDAEVLSLLVTTLDLADEDEFSRFARLYGASVQRLVGAGLQLFDVAVRQHIEALDLSYAERDRLVYERAATYTELVSTIVPWLQRRHREHTVLEYIVGVTEEFMDKSGLMPSHPKQPPAIVFLDLAGYTAFAEERGDEAAAEVAADLAVMVQETAQTHGGRPVKWLGDGVMFHFSDPGNAIASGLDLVEQAMSATSVLPARIGINAGAVIAQEGDYFGRTVNVASRIADYAQPHEVLVSDEAMRNADVPEAEFELVGDVMLKGLTRAVRLHRATRAAS